MQCKSCNIANALLSAEEQQNTIPILLSISPVHIQALFDFRFTFALSCFWMSVLCSQRPLALSVQTINWSIRQCSSL